MRRSRVSWFVRAQCLTFWGRGGATMRFAYMSQGFRFPHCQFSKTGGVDQRLTCGTYVNMRVSGLFVHPTRLALEPATFGSILHTTDVEPTLLHPFPNIRRSMISMCRDWPDFRLAPEPATFGSFRRTADVEPTLLHPVPNIRKVMISKCRDWPDVRLAPEPATFWNFLCTDMWSPPCSIRSRA